MQSVSLLSPPTRIKYKNSLTKDLEFHIFFRNLLRRISLLSYFYCNHRIDDSGFKDIIERAGKIKTVKRSLYWQDWERYSNRQETRMKMGGFMGEITYEGELKEFWPYIKLGEYVHVGKGVDLGWGGIFYQGNPLLSFPLDLLIRKLSDVDHRLRLEGFCYKGDYAGGEGGA